MAKVRVNLDPMDAILLKRKLNKNGKAQLFFTHEVRRLSDPYVPFQTGALKNIQVQVYADKIHYKAPYARKQFYENKGYGNQGTSKGGLRGRQWTQRMWSDKGKDVVQSVAKFCGGKRK